MLISIREHLHPPQMQGFQQICSPGPLPIQSCEFRLVQGGCSKLARSRGVFVDRVCEHACAGILWKIPGQVLGKPPSEFALHMLPVYIHNLLNSLWFGSLKPCVRRVSTLPLSSSPAYIALLQQLYLFFSSPLRQGLLFIYFSFFL